MPGRPGPWNHRDDADVDWDGKEMEVHDAVFYSEYVPPS
jgi:hypothetical protein